MADPQPIDYATPTPRPSGRWPWWLLAGLGFFVLLLVLMFLSFTVSPSVRVPLTPSPGAPSIPPPPAPTGPPGAGAN